MDILRPHFLIIGAAKAGTTSLYHYLNQHPQIYMSPVKEPNFFSLQGVKSFGGPHSPLLKRSVLDPAAYQALFAEATERMICGEASPTYLYYAHTARRIRDFNPAMRIIAILRNPVERAYSNYLFLRREGREPLPTFRQALDAEPRRREENWEFIWHYIELGYYAKQLKHYYEIFPPSQIKICLYDHYQKNPRGTLKEIFRFLNVDEQFEPDIDVQWNISGIPKSLFLQRLLSRPNVAMQIVKRFLPPRVRKRVKYNLVRRNLQRPPMPPEDRRFLLQLYREDILELQDLTGYDLSYWLSE